ncbi:MAG: hypothetical protein IKK75_11575, partial [Clostridia bacterium]|nr:hypothetical protein [Clostridia bacterium]
VISIDIPNNSIVEANIRLSLNNPQATFGDIISLTRPNGTPVGPISRGTPRDGDVVVGNSGAYYNMKLIRPSQGEWRLTLNVNEAMRISAEIIANYDIGIRFRNLPNPEEIRKGDPLRLEAEFYSTTTGEAYAEDEYLYQLDMITQSIATRDGEPLGEFFQVERADNGTYLFVGEIEALDKGIYEFQVKADGAGIQAETEVFCLELVNNPPICIGSDFSEPVNLSVDSMLWRTAEDSMEINLHQFFRDPDGDPLTFIVTGRNDVLTTRVTSAGILQITCEQAGECALFIKANDGELDSNRNLTITFNVKSCKQQAIRELLIGLSVAAVAALVVCMVVLPIRKRKAQLKASRQLTITIGDLAPLNLPVVSIPERGISLWALLNSHGYADDFQSASEALQQVVLFSDAERVTIHNRSQTETVQFGHALQFNCADLKCSVAMQTITPILDRKLTVVMDDSVDISVNLSSTAASKLNLWQMLVMNGHADMCKAIQQDASAITFTVEGSALAVRNRKSEDTTGLGSTLAFECGEHTFAVTLEATDPNA